MFLNDQIVKWAICFHVYQAHPSLSSLTWFVLVSSCSPALSKTPEVEAGEKPKMFYYSQERTSGPTPPFPFCPLSPPFIPLLLIT